MENEFNNNNQFNNNIQQETNLTVTTGDWIITMIISGIPLVGLVMLFIWAFSENTLPSKKNWARATLIFALVVFILYIFVFGTVFASLVASMH